MIEWVYIKDENGVIRGAVSKEWHDNAMKLLDEAAGRMAAAIEADIEEMKK